GDDGVVPGHRAGDPLQAGLVDGPRHHVRRPRGGADDDQELDLGHREHELSRDRDGLADPVARAGPYQTEVLDVERDRRLGLGIPALRERQRQLLLGLDRPVPDQLEDGALAAFLHVRCARLMAATARSISSALITSGGTRPTVRSSVALTITPSSKHLNCSPLATGSRNTTARISPRPRTSSTPSSPVSSLARSSP